MTSFQLFINDVVSKESCTFVNVNHVKSLL